MRIAVFGGSFNPIHYGHLRAAEEAAAAARLDRVLFIPASRAPHKPPCAVAGRDRLAMVRLAIRGNPVLAASDMELKRGGVSYTVDTLRRLDEGRGGVKGGLKLSLILGADSFNEITTWREYAAILDLASVVVVQRPGYPASRPAEALPVELAKSFWYDSRTRSYRNSRGNSISYLDTTPIGVSSSGIRKLVRSGASARYLLPDGVLAYIKRKGLYAK